MSRTVRGAVLERLDAACRRLELASGGFGEYRDDPCSFFRRVLHWDPWSKQEEIAQALATDDLVTAVSGNGVGKTQLAAAIVWWFIMTRGSGCRVFLTSAKGDQSEQGIWRAVRQHYFRAMQHGRPLGGTMPKLGKTGWDGVDGEQIVVLTADKAEAFQGLRAPEMLIVADEASGIDDRIFEAIMANLSGGGKLLLIGNPMKSTGFFAESHREGSGFIRCHISVLHSPNVVAGKTIIKGLADRGFVSRMKHKYGEDAPIYKIRVLGEFIVNEAGKPIPWVFIEDAQKRWAGAPGNGVLCVGVDPAGPGQFGDMTAIVWRRGWKMLGYVTGQAWSEDAIIRHVLDLVREHRHGDECPRVIVDAGGPIGSPLYSRLLGIAKGLTPEKRMSVFGVRADQAARREPENYTTMRDELFECLARWIKSEGAIPPHTGLAEELHAPMWIGYGKGRLKLTSKDEIRKLLGRSPDLADALALAVWALEDPEPHYQNTNRPPPTAPPTQNIYQTHQAFNPYRGLDAFMPKPGQSR